MATITRRGPGQWRARVRRTGYPAQSNTLPSRAEAEAWARLIESEMDRGVWQSRSEAERTTLGEVLARYRAEVTPAHKGALKEGNRLKAIEGRPIAQRRLASLRSADIAKYRDERLLAVSGMTASREIALIRAVLNHARREWGIHCENPVTLVKLPPEPPHRERRMTPDEETRILVGAVPELRDCIVLLVETGLRASELCRARREHLNVRRRTLTIPEAKSGKPRTVPLSQRVAALVVGRPARIDGWLVGYRTPEALSHAFLRVVRKVGIENLRLHDLRHTCLSRLAERGWTAAELMALSGHSQLGMLSRYVHITPEHLVGKLDAG